MDYDKEINDLKIEVAVMNTKIESHYAGLREAIAHLTTLWEEHHDETRRAQERKSENKWGVGKGILVGVSMLVLTFLWQKITKG